VRRSGHDRGASSLCVLSGQSSVFNKKERKGLDADRGCRAAAVAAIPSLSDGIRTHGKEIVEIAGDGRRPTDLE